MPTTLSNPNAISVRRKTTRKSSLWGLLTHDIRSINLGQVLMQTKRSAADLPELTGREIRAIRRKVHIPQYVDIQKTLQNRVLIEPPKVSGFEAITHGYRQVGYERKLAAWEAKLPAWEARKRQWEEANTRYREWPPKGFENIPCPYPDPGKKPRRYPPGKPRPPKGNISVADHGIITFGAAVQDRITENPDLADQMYKAIVTALAEEFDVEPLGLVVHADETAPHAHFYTSSFTKSGEAASPILGRSGKLIQDIAARVAREYFPAIERGHSAKQTGLENKSVKDLHAGLGLGPDATFNEVSRSVEKRRLKEEDRAKELAARNQQAEATLAQTKRQQEQADQQLEITRGINQREEQKKVELEGSVARLKEEEAAYKKRKMSPGTLLTRARRKKEQEVMAREDQLAADRNAWEVEKSAQAAQLRKERDEHLATTTRMIRAREERYEKALAAIVNQYFYPDAEEGSHARPVWQKGPRFSQFKANGNVQSMMKDLQTHMSSPLWDSICEFAARIRRLIAHQANKVPLLEEQIKSLDEDNADLRKRLGQMVHPDALAEAKANAAKLWQVIADRDDPDMATALLEKGLPDDYIRDNAGRHGARSILNRLDQLRPRPHSPFN